MERILLIEDEKSIAEVFRKQLTLIGGWEVDVAANGKEGLDFLSENEYSVILTDLVMPVMDGIEFLEILTKDKKSEEMQYSHAPIIVLTNVTSDETKENVRDLGVEDFIIKTDVEPKTLIEKIKKVAQ
jgi:CheY-like chemotaxis protein